MAQTDSEQPATANEPSGEPQAPPRIWPPYMPEGCPESQPEHTGRLFRLVSSVPVSLEDPLMRCATQTGAWRGQDECRRSSLSCSDRIEELLTLRQTQTATFARARMAAIDVNPALGRARSTPTRRLPHHWSLWLTSAAFAAAPSLFSEVAS